ncbi:hypothetical protein PV08_03905 [Exophiala spinifera]|uniref:Transcription factor domain-containing protein n=1 Tax=Exophiala spinifera TaxID=91928 RepID=A0A0D1YNN6_9EURO|nr:uncharacterized protein PV08_03905 [Exophiala spinifera]KIW16716.1 hypothetical protein PV08_03905 [Exophiala spinifera]
MPKSPKIHFVHENEPGTPLDPTQVRALRSHVRQVNLERSQQRTTQRMENFRSLSIDDFSENGEIRPGKRRFASRPEPTTTSQGPSELGDEAPIQHAVPQLDFNTRPEQSVTASSRSSFPLSDSSHSVSRERNRPASTTPGLHPYTSNISAVTGLDEGRVDQLLTSYAFQMALDPLITAEHDECDVACLSTFPDLLGNPAFLFALVYSMVLSSNAWRCSNESLHLKGRAIECLHQALPQDNTTLRALSICAILMLCHAASRSGEYTEYAAHSEGLYHLMQVWRTSGSALPSDVLRAVFWHDLTGAGIFGALRRFSEVDFPSLFNQSLDRTYTVQQDLPFGFVSHEEVIHHDLLSCLKEITGLQKIVAMNSLESVALDDIRASIVSRLVVLQQACESLGPVSECCRLAAYIVCHLCSKTACAHAPHVPVRLSEKLAHVLQDTIRDAAWHLRHDLLLWLVFVGASASRCDGDLFRPLNPQYRHIMEVVLQLAVTWVKRREGELVLQSAKAGFLYSGDWVAQRHLIPNWTELERMVSETPHSDKESHDR